MSKLPELCFSILPSTGELICIKYEESGYYPSSYNTPSRQQNEIIADRLNDTIGVSKAQRQAMEIGSMFGWDAPGADPDTYETEQPIEMKIL